MSNLQAATNTLEPAETGFLKLKLITAGLFVEQKLAKTLAEHSLTGWLDLVLPGKVWVRAPFRVNAGNLEHDKDSIVLNHDVGGFSVSYSGKYVPVEIPGIPEFYEKTTSSGRKMSSVGTSYAGYLSIAPSSACAEWGHLLQCRYCAYGLDASLAADIPTVDDVVETVGEALKGNHARQVHFYFGYYNTEDGGASFFAPYISAVKKKHDVLISVQATPPDNSKWIDYLYALGVDSIAFNLEVFDTDFLKKVSPQSASLINRSKYLDALKYAVKIFPAGAVTSELLLGMEPAESTKAGIDYLVAVGVLPTLSILQPGEGCASRAVDLPDAAEMMPLFEYLSKSAGSGNFGRRWVDHFNILMNVEPENFSSRRKYGHTLTKKLGPAFSKIRRAIRVKEVGR